MTGNDDKLKHVKMGDPHSVSQFNMLVDAAKRSSTSRGEFSNQGGSYSRNILPPTFPALNYGSNEQVSQLFFAKVMEDPADDEEAWIGTNGGIMCRIYFIHDHGSNEPVSMDEDWWITPPGDGVTQADYAEVAWTKDGTGVKPDDILTVSGTSNIVANFEAMVPAKGDGTRRVWTGNLAEQPMPHTVYLYGTLPEAWLIDDPNRYLAQMGASTNWNMPPKASTDAVESWRGLLWGNVRLDNVLQVVPAGNIPGLDWGTSWVDYRGAYAYSVDWQVAAPDKTTMSVIYRPVSSYKFTWVQTASTSETITFDKWFDITGNQGYTDINDGDFSRRNLSITVYWYGNADVPAPAALAVWNEEGVQLWSPEQLAWANQPADLVHLDRAFRFQTNVTSTNQDIMKIVQAGNTTMKLRMEGATGKLQLQVTEQSNRTQLWISIIASKRMVPADAIAIP